MKGSQLRFIPYSNFTWNELSDFLSSKNDRKISQHIHSQPMDTDDFDFDIERVKDLEREILYAIERNEFEVVYQPKLDIQTHVMTGTEALLRWNSRKHGAVSPEEFIPISENNDDLMHEIGEHVLDCACRQNKSWQDEWLPKVSVAVNISARQLGHGRLVEMVRWVLEKTGMESQYLELEITESCLIEEAETAIKTLHQLKELGIFISMDDFGTGFSNLNFLNRLPLDILKIDKSFIKNSETFPEAVTAIIDMAKAYGLKIVAEWVETQKQLDFLKGKECPMIIQWFFFSKPIHPSELGPFLQKQRSVQTSLWN